MAHGSLIVLAFVALWAPVLHAADASPNLPVSQSDGLPNILWITSEDNGPHLGCYGDTYADTPNIDGLAARGTVYLNAWSTAPVCAPARTTIISGLFPTSTGSEHMRSMTRLPDGMLMYPQYLREAGYYCTNNRKEDYNLRKPGRGKGGVWNESSGTAHWRNREPGQPFFAIFNYTTTHESQIRKRPHEAVHDPAKVRVPAYHPDTPEVRQDWAQYYDKLTAMDRQVGNRLRELEEAGLAEDTIVFYYGDHGPGMPRSKRWPYNSGLHVPLVVYIPEKFENLAPSDYSAGGKSSRLVGFIDLAPTVISLAGKKPPEHLQGHAFLGEHAAPPPRYQFGFRGRMDERYDMVRVVRDERYIYIRNFMPHKIYGQHVAYMFQTPTTQVWKRLHDEGKLDAAQDRFWNRKPAEELYDLRNDPDEVKNLVGVAGHEKKLRELRGALRNHLLDTRDVGFLPEGEIHERSRDSTPYEMGHDAAYPLRAILDTAERASSLKSEDLPELIDALGAKDSAVRYWGAMGVLMRGETAVREPKTASVLERALKDESPYVRAIAAQAFAEFGTPMQFDRALDVLIDLAAIDRHGVYVSMLALNAIDAIDEKIEEKAAIERIKALPRTTEGIEGRMRSYVPRLLEKVSKDLE